MIESICKQSKSLGLLGVEPRREAARGNVGHRALEALVDANGRVGLEELEVLFEGLALVEGLVLDVATAQHDHLVDAEEREATRGAHDHPEHTEVLVLDELVHLVRREAVFVDVRHRVEERGAARDIKVRRMCIALAIILRTFL